MSELTKQLLSLIIVCTLSFSLCSEASQPEPFTIPRNLGAPFPSPYLEMYALTPCAALRSRAIGIVLAARTEPQIAPPVVQSIAVDVVNFLTCTRSHQKPMEIDEPLTRSRLIAAVSTNVSVTAGNMDMPFVARDDAFIGPVDPYRLAANPKLSHAPTLDLHDQRVNDLVHFEIVEDESA